MKLNGGQENNIGGINGGSIIDGGGQIKGRLAGEWNGDQEEEKREDLEVSSRKER